MALPVDDKSLDARFLAARTLRKWQDKPVSEGVPRRLYELTIHGPTSGNCCSSRFVFVITPEGRKRLIPHLSASNVDTTLEAPGTVIVATDNEFWKEMPSGAKMTKVFAGMGAPALTHRFHNCTLQSAYPPQGTRGRLRDFTTQVFFEGDPLLQSDVIFAVKKDQVVDPVLDAAGKMRFLEFNVAMAPKARLANPTARPAPERWAGAGR